MVVSFGFQPWDFNNAAFLDKSVKGKCMALLFLEGFEGYSSTTAMVNASAGPCKWSQIWNSGTGSSISLSTTYRTEQVTVGNSRSLYMAAGSDHLNCCIETPASTELIVGVGFRYATASIGVAGLISFGGSNSSSQGVVLGINSSQQIYAATASSYGAPGTSLGVASTSLNPNTWYYVEVRAKLSTTAGEFEVYVNGVQVLNLSGVNTATGSISSYQTVTLGGCNNNSITAYFDDVYICDTTGATNNTFIGPVSVYSLMPNGAGSATEMTATGAATNWEAVADPTDDSTDYVATSTTGQKDYYTFESLPGTVTTVAGVQLKARSTLPTSGTRKLKMNLKNGASVISSALRALATGTWLQNSFVSDTAPDGTAWTPTQVNNTEGGIEAG